MGQEVAHEMNPVYFRSCHYPTSGIDDVRRDSANTEKDHVLPVYLLILTV